MDPRIKHDAGQKYSPYYVRFGGKKRYFKTAELAQDALRGRTTDTAATLGPRAVSEYRTAKSLLPPGTSLVYVAEQFMRASKMDISRSVEQSIAEYLEARGKEQLRPRYMYRMNQIMRWFRGEAGTVPLATINYGMVEDWCRARGSPHQQHEARTHLSILFSYCLRRQWIDKNPADGKVVTLTRVPKPIVGFLTVDQTRTILNGAWEHARDLVAPFAIQLFCGVRTEEVTRLWWDTVQLDTHVDVPEKVSKTGERRVIDWWPENLTSWLKPLRAETGLVAPANYTVRRSLLMTKLKVQPPHNAFRHSYATYGVAYHQDAAKISLMLGHHEPDLIFRHYRAYATPAEGKEYFSIGRA